MTVKTKITYSFGMLGKYDIDKLIKNIEYHPEPLSDYLYGIAMIERAYIKWSASINKEIAKFKNTKISDIKDVNELYFILKACDYSWQKKIELDKDFKKYRETCEKLYNKYIKKEDN